MSSRPNLNSDGLVGGDAEDEGRRRAIVKRVGRAAGGLNLRRKWRFRAKGTPDGLRVYAASSED